MSKKQYKEDAINWFWKFRPDLKINEIFIENLYNEYMSTRENLLLDEKSSFYSYVVFNYKSDKIDLIYAILEGNENYNAILERWVEEDRNVFHIGNLIELIDKNDPIENQENYPHLDFNNEEEVNVVYVEMIKSYNELV